MATKSGQKFYILDGHAILHRSWHALPALATKDGRLVNAAYGFLLVLFKLLREEKPSHLAVTFDMAEPTFRHEEYEDYKATRQAAPDEFYEQIPVLQKILKALRIPIYEKSGYEADDVIGTIAAKTSAKGIETIIVTGDLDTLQLVDENVKVYTFARGIKEAKLYDAKAIKERYGLTPDQLIDYKALRGDPSDNIKGVPGVGEKTAIELIKTFGSVEELYEALKNKTTKMQKLRERVVTALTEGKDEAYRSKKLVTIRRDVPITFSLADTKIEEPDYDVLTPLFQDLEFGALLKKIPGAPAEEIKPEKTSRRAVSYSLVSSKTEAVSLVEKLGNLAQFALRACPQSEDIFSRDVLGVAIAWESGQAAFVPHKYLKEFISLFVSEKILKIGHDLKHEWHLLRGADAPLGGKLGDVMIASYLLAPGSRKHGLRDLVFEHFGKQLVEETSQRSLLPPQIDTIYPSACQEADYVLALYKKLFGELEERRQEKLFSEIEMEVLPALAMMERNGVMIDSEFLKVMGKKMHQRISVLTKKMCGLAGMEFNVNSPTQLKEVLFEKLKLPPKVKKTPTGDLSTAADELEKLRGEHEIIDLIFEHRELAKLVSTYVDALPELVRRETGRVHTTFNQAVTSTGRLSSSDPNLQNIPIRSELGREVRRAFVAPRGCVLLAADYSQIELRLAAEIAKVKKMRQAFLDGVDIHRATAAEVWNVPLDKVTKEQRYAAKAINFGLLYGMGARSLAHSAGMSLSEAQEFIQRYFQVYPEIAAYVDEAKAQAAAQGYVETLFGRRRYLPEITSSVPQVRAAAERMATNAPLQGSAADLIKLAMISIHDWIEKQYGIDPDAEVKMILQVHDELVFEVKRGLETAVAKKVKELMEGAGKFSVPIVADVRTGHSWGDLK